jgi:hypothetical protein
MATESVNIKVQVDAGDGVKNVGNIRRELKEANAELIAAQRNFGEYSAEAVAAAKRVAQLRDAVQEARETADLFDPGKKFQAFSGAINAVAGGFTAVQGALGLVGVESAEVEKQLLKVQSALALSQGLSTITDSAKDFQRLAVIIRTQVVTAFSTLRGALVATGIGALVVGIGLLVANFDAVVAAIRKVIPGFDAFVGGVRRAINAVTDFIGVTSEADRQLDKLKQANKERSEQIERDIKILTAAGGKEGEIYSKRREQIGNEIALLKEREKAGQKLTEAELKQKLDLQADATALDLTEDKRVRDQAEQRAKEARDRAKQAAQEAGEAEKARLEAIRAQQDAFDAAEKDRLGKSKQQIDAANKILDDARKERELNRLEGRERELQELEFQYFEEQQAAEGNYLALLALEESYLIRRKEINDKFDVESSETAAKNAQTSVDRTIAQLAAETAARQKAADDQKAIDEARKIATEQIYAQIGNAIGSLSTLLGRNTAAGKVAALAEIAINTGVGFANGLRIAQQSAVATGPGAAFAFPVFYATQVAAVLAAVARAKSVLQGVAGPGGGGASAPSVGNTTAPLAPALPLTQTVTQLQSGTINQLQSATTRAYVVESDVTGAQERIQRLNRAARLG